MVITIKCILHKQSRVLDHTMEIVIIEHIWRRIIVLVSNHTMDTMLLPQQPTLGISTTAQNGPQDLTNPCHSSLLKTILLTLVEEISLGAP